MYKTVEINGIIIIHYNLFIYLFRLHRVLVVACGIFVAACGLFEVVACGLLSCGTHVGSSSLTRDQTRAPCTGSVET